MADPRQVRPYGRILCVGDAAVFGYGRDPQYLCNSSLLEYRLYSAAKEAQEGEAVKPSVTWKSLAEQPEARLTRLAFNWKKPHPPLLVRAMALANDTLFVAGPPDLVDERAMWGRSNESQFQEKMRAQAEALLGGQGALLWALSAQTGEQLAEYRLDDVPSFDGMTVAGGRLFLATGSRLLCFN